VDTEMPIMEEAHEWLKQEAKELEEEMLYL